MNSKAQTQLLVTLFVYTPLAALIVIGLAAGWNPLVVIVSAVGGALIGGLVLVFVITRCGARPAE